MKAKHGCIAALTVVVVLFMAVFLAIRSLLGHAIGSGNVTDDPLAARKGFHTTIKMVKLDTENNAHTGSFPSAPPPNIYRLVHYPSPAGNLAAYVSPDPGDGRKHPVIVWAHGGFGGIDDFLWKPDDAQDPGAFLRAGFIVMCPSWRGENDNPGQYEMFYGEVEDAVAAVDYASRLPYVDPKRVYMGGHSTGGTITMLTAECTTKLRAAFAFGGAPNMYQVVRTGKGYGNTPYDYQDREESRLRSPIEFTRSIKCPMWYFEGEDSAYSDEAYRMQTLAMKYQIPFYVNIVEGGDHFSILQPICSLIAQKISRDSGDRCAISISHDEVLSAFNSRR